MTSPPPANWAAFDADDDDVVVWVDDMRFVVPQLDTVPLLDALSRGDGDAIMPGRCDEQQRQRWYSHLYGLDSDFDLADAQAVTSAVIEQLTGVPASTAVALAAWLTNDWLLVDGYHLRGGVDLLTLPPRRLFATLYAFIVEHRFESRDEADAALFPLVARLPTEAELARDAANFEAAMAMAEAFEA